MAALRGSSMRPILMALVVLFPISGDAWAWGDQGHKVICEIAIRLAQPSTRAEIQKLISNDERFTSFSDACTWPDHPRQRASEHFLNLPRDSDGLSSESCPGASACVVTAIKKDFEVLSSNNASQAQKLGSLKFLGHWVGDIHQPLHVSFEDDRGGNNVMVSGECGPNLHSAWDTCLVLKAVGQDVGEAATELMKTITPAKIESWTHSKPMDWANESFAIAERAQTEYCVRQGASCDHPSGKVTIDAAYVGANTPIVKEQLQKAGVRLAHLLDAALGK
jgi:S1/P1 Nuclease